MGRQAAVPASLARRAFTREEASLAGVTRRQLEGRAYRRVARGVYRAARVAESPEMILAAVQGILPPCFVFSGGTAAWLHGLDLVPCDPVEVIVPEACWVRPRTRLSVVRTAVARSEIVCVRGVPATSILRTMSDLGRRAPLVDAVVAIDEATHRGLVDKDELALFAAAHTGGKGIARLRAALDMAEPATESPMETRLRLLIVMAGLPRPAVQVSLHHEGRFLARPDLLYEAERLAIEYDGAIHRESLVKDNRRQNRLVAAGYRLLRFTASDLAGHPDAVVSQVRGELFRQRRP